MSWETVIGLEVHVQLATRTKLFCGCSTTFGEIPNRHVCPVCLGLPGALPATNREAVRLAMRAAHGLECAVHPESEFARKHYFYPDLPKGYQISQFDRPIATGGHLEVASPDRGEVTIGITRLHIEEDAGKSIHDRFAGRTAVDYNRAGVPLIEVVSDPDLRSPAEARAYLVALKQLLQYLEISDCSMEEGRLRVDANLSVRPEAAVALGVKQEIKNMNSFAQVERSLEQLRAAQVELLEHAGVVNLVTYSAATGALRPMRSKEESHDYRYLHDPDLPPLHLAPDWIERERVDLPELPATRRRRLVHQYDITPYEAQVIVSTRATAHYYEAVCAAGAPAQAAAHWVMGPVLRDANEHHGAFRVPPARLAELLGLVEDGTVSRQAAKRVFAALAEGDGSPRVIAGSLGLVQVADVEQIVKWIDAVTARHAEEVGRYRGGESKLLGFFMGQVMNESGGQANPAVVKRLLPERLGSAR